MECDGGRIFSPTAFIGYLQDRFSIFQLFSDLARLLLFFPETPSYGSLTFSQLTGLYHIRIKLIQGIHQPVDLAPIVEQVGGNPQGIGISWITLVQMKIGIADLVAGLFLQARDHCFD